MRDIRPLVAAALLFASYAAFAQSPTAPANGNGAGASGSMPTTPATAAPQGFFPPTPGDDPSLFRTLPPEAYERASGANVAPATPAPSPAPAAPVVVVVPERGAMQDQLDRAAREAAEERARTLQYPAPINGAFTGLTDERDR